MEILFHQANEKYPGLLHLTLYVTLIITKVLTIG
jgi:hypothetical protein